MPPAGAAAEMASVTFAVLVAFTLMVLGFSESVTVTVTVPVSGANPTAVAVNWVAPIATPVTWGFAAGTSRPAGDKTFGGVVATRGFARSEVMYKPCAGAGYRRAIGPVP